MIKLGKKRFQKENVKHDKKINGKSKWQKEKLISKVNSSTTTMLKNIGLGIKKTLKKVLTEKYYTLCTSSLFTTKLRLMLNQI